MNSTQALPKTTLLTSSSLQLNDLFWTVQGEGQWTGRRALFIRLPFCNYDCPWCDTEYNSFKKISEDEFIAFCQQEPSRFAVITGGEPMAHKDLKRVIMLLKQQGFYIACETNGSLPIPEDIDFPTVSPKRYTQNKHPEFFIHEEAWLRAKEFKYVVDDDFNFALLDRHQSPLRAQPEAAPSKLPEQSEGPPQLTTNTAVNQRPAALQNVDSSFPSGNEGSSSVRLSLTPEYSTMKKQLPRILSYIQENPQWQLNLQTHKWIEIP